MGLGVSTVTLEIEFRLGYSSEEATMEIARMQVNSVELGGGSRSLDRASSGSAPDSSWGCCQDNLVHQQHNSEGALL